MRQPVLTAKIVSWVGIGLLGISVIVAVASVPTSTTYVLDVASFLAVVAGAMVACSQLALFRLQVVEEHERSRRERSLSYSIINSPELLKAREHIEAFFPKEIEQVISIPIEKLDGVTQPATGGNEQHVTPIMVKYLLAHWGNLALTIAAGATDEQFAFELVGSLLVEHVTIFTYYIQRSQRRDPRTYIYLTHLAARWEKKLRERAPEPVYVPPLDRMSFDDRIAFLKSMERSTQKDGARA